jgi:hypothetical protein
MFRRGSQPVKGMRWLLPGALLLALSPPQHSRAETLPAAPPLTVAQADAAHVVLAWEAPPLTLAPTTHDGVALVTPRLAGLPALAPPGEPNLPAAALLLAVPPGATATATVLDAATTLLPLPAPLAAAPSMSAPVEPLEPLPSPVLSSPARAASLRAGLAPAEVVTISPPVQWRSQTVVRVRIHPVQVDAAQRQAIFHQRLRIEVRFHGGDRTQRPPVDEGAFEPVLAAHLGNYAAARAWRRPPAAAPAARRPASGPWLRITTDRAGLHRISCTALAAAGVDLAAIDPTTLRLYRDGASAAEAALWLDGVEGDCADAGLIFYAEAVDTPYTGQAVYWLTYGGAPGQRMAVQPARADGVQVSAYAQTTRHEVNRLYFSFIPLAEDAHHWYWDVLSARTGISRTYTFTLAAAAPGPTHLGLDLAGYDGAHRTLVALNGQPVADLAWSGRAARRFELPLVPAQLIPGDNALTISAAGGSADYQYMDGYTITAAQPLAAVDDRLVFASTTPGPQQFVAAGFSSADVLVVDVTEPLHPRRVEGATTSAAPCPCTVHFGAAGPSSYVVLARPALAAPVAVARARPFTLHDATNQADYLMIAPADFHAALAPLAAYRTAQGLRTQIVDLQAIYDEFGGGEVDPFALRAFLRHTLTAWQTPAPAYVLLVGDGVNDPRGFVDAPPANSVPALLRAVDPRLGETASDNQYVTLTDGDNLPQFALGRFPAQSATDVAALVEKTLRYEQQAAPGEWRRRMTVVADNAFAADGAPDDAGNFWALADGLAMQPGLTAAGYQVERLYFNPCPPDAHPQCILPDIGYPAASDLTAALAAGLHAGRQLLLYVGHGSPVAWAGNPSLLTADQVAALANEDRLTVTLDLTCYTGFFQAPRQVALAETLLAAPGGAVATWASSGVSVASGHDALARGFLAAVAQEQPASVGLATVAGKLELWTAGGGAYRENIDTFHLFGDPALRLAGTSPSAPTTGVYLPWISAGSQPP